MRAEKGTCRAKGKRASAKPFFLGKFLDPAEKTRNPRSVSRSMFYKSFEKIAKRLKCARALAERIGSANWQRERMGRAGVGRAWVDGGQGALTIAAICQLIA
jgi:hypothetical protein